jgi:uncharacterized membrane protein YcaP (DUF421 family)
MGITEWNDLLVSQIPLLEKVVRTVVVYLVIALLLRLVGKRNLAQFNTFDLVVVLLLSNVVQNAIIGPDNSLVGGLIGAVVLISIDNLVVRLTARSERVARWVDGQPTEIARDGAFDHSALRKLALRRVEVEEAMHRQGVSDITDVELATLDPNGSIAFSLRDSAQPATRADIDRLMARLDALAR